LHRPDLVLSDHAIPTGLNVKAYHHGLGESSIAFFAHKQMSAKYARKFPESLDDAPMRLPVITSALRRSLDDGFDRVGVVPRVVAEFDDSALMKAFWEAAIGTCPAPVAIADEVEHMYHARTIGMAHRVKETFFAISPERTLKHPAVVQITESATALLN
jgi:LysR family transcriptional activator of nhaA